MQKAINRFWDWLFHPSIRWYHYPKGKSAWFRYPSPGNIIRKHEVQDYKVPFEHSELNIRYKKPVHSLIPKSRVDYVADAPGYSVIDKLRATGLLEAGENSQDQIELAKKKFLEKYGVPVEQRVYINTMGLKTIQPTNRQSYRQVIEQQIKSKAQQIHNLQMPQTNRKFIQQPESVWLQSLDLYSHPHFQQTRIDVNYKLDQYGNENAKRGYIEIRKGERSFWKALDNSNDPKNIERVQRAIHDETPNDFRLRDTKIEFKLDSKGNVVDVDPKTRSV